MAFIPAKIEESNQALAAGDLQAAVLALVEVWAKLPSTRIASLVLKLSSRLPHDELPSKVAEREARWIELASTLDPKVVPTLLSVEWPVHPRGVKARIDELQKFSPDPRIAHALRELWLGGRYRSHAGGVFWRRAFRLLLNWKNPEAAALIEAAKSTDDGYFIVKPIMDKRTSTPLPKEPTLASDLARALDEIEAAAGIESTSLNDVSRASKESLFQAVYDDPSSAAPRLVLADFLLQEGDARGELIQLMHAIESGHATGKVEARARSLLRASGKKWLDGIGSMVKDYVFRCGFASEVTLCKKLDPTSPGWGTVETLHLENAFAVSRVDADVLLHPNLRAVTHLDGVASSALERLADGLALGRTFDRLGVLAPLTPLPTSTKIQVRHLAVGSGDNVSIDVPDALAWFDASAFRQTTKVFEISAPESGIAAAIKYLDATPSLDAIWLRPLFYGSYPITWEVRVSRDPAASNKATIATGTLAGFPNPPAILEATWHGRDYNVSGTGGLARAITALSENALTQIVLRETTRMSPGARRDLAYELRTATATRHPRATVTTAFSEEQEG